MGISARREARIKVHKRLRDAKGHEAELVRSLIDGVVAWGGPMQGKARAEIISFDPSMGGKHKNLVVGMTLIPPANEVSMHAHSLEEAYVVIKGKGIVYTDKGDEAEVVWGDAIWFSPGTVHCIRNHTDEDLWLVFCWGHPNVPSVVDALARGGELAKKQGGEYAREFAFELIGPP